MSDHEFLGPRARIEELLERRAHLELDAGHGHPGRMSAAQDEHDEPPEKEESAEKRPDAHRRREDLPHLPEHARCRKAAATRIIGRTNVSLIPRKMSNSKR